MKVLAYFILEVHYTGVVDNPSRQYQHRTMLKIKVARVNILRRDFNFYVWCVETVFSVSFFWL